jgi:hypothetical protein
MLALRRLLLVIFVLVGPVAMTGLLYLATNALLAATNRVIDPQVVIYAAAIECAVFFLLALLEAKSRWSA